MISQYTRELIRKEAEAKALEKSSVKVEVKSSESKEVSEVIVDQSPTEKKTDAEKLKSKKKER